MLGTISSLVFGPPPLTREQRYLFFGEGDAPADAPPMRVMLYAHDNEAYVTADEMARCRAWLGGGPRDGLVSEDAAGASVLSVSSSAAAAEPSVGVGARSKHENAGRDSAVSADAPAFFKGPAIPIFRHM